MAILTAVSTFGSTARASIYDRKVLLLIPVALPAPRTAGYAHASRIPSGHSVPAPGSTAAPLSSRYGSAVHASIRCTAGGSPPHSSCPAAGYHLPALRTATAPLSSRYGSAVHASIRCTAGGSPPQSFLTAYGCHFPAPRTTGHARVSRIPSGHSVPAPGSTAAPLPSRHGSAVHASIRCTAGGSPPQSSCPAAGYHLPALRTAGRTHAARTPDDHSVPAPGYPALILYTSRKPVVTLCPTARNKPPFSAGSTAAPLPSRHGSAVHASIRCTAGGSPPHSSCPAAGYHLPALRTAPAAIPAYLFLYNSSRSGGLQGYNTTGCL